MVIYAALACVGVHNSSAIWTQIVVYVLLRRLTSRLLPLAQQVVRFDWSCVVVGHAPFASNSAALLLHELMYHLEAMAACGMFNTGNYHLSWTKFNLHDAMHCQSVHCTLRVPMLLLLHAWSGLADALQKLQLVKRCIVSASWQRTKCVGS